MPIEAEIISHINTLMQSGCPENIDLAYIIGQGLEVNMDVFVLQ